MPPDSQNYTRDRGFLDLLSIRSTSYLLRQPDHYTTQQKKADRERGCTEDQISAIGSILKYDPKEWYDILAVSDTCTTEEVNQAYEEKSLAVHPKKNPSSEAYRAFQIVENAANALRHGDEYKGEDATNSERSKGSRAIKTQERAMTTLFQKEIYKLATPYMEALIENPWLGNWKELDQLNDHIKRQNERDGKEGVDKFQGTIDYHTHVAMFKLVDEYKKLIKKTPTTPTERRNQAMAEEKLPQIWQSLDVTNTARGYPQSWNTSQPETLGLPGSVTTAGPCKSTMSHILPRYEKPAEGYMAKVMRNVPYQEVPSFGNVRPNLIKTEPLEETKVINTGPAQDIDMVSTHALAKQLNNEVEGLKEQMNEMRTYMLQLLTC
ncbi:hypothetical protein HYALB_00014060, partial [Hymenoscyphus albidus]